MKEIKIDSLNQSTSENKELTISEEEQERITSNSSENENSNSNSFHKSKEDIDSKRENEINNQIFGLQKKEKDFYIKSYLIGNGKNPKLEEISTIPKQEIESKKNSYLKIDNKANNISHNEETNELEGIEKLSSSLDEASFVSSGLDEMAFKQFKSNGIGSGYSQENLASTFEKEASETINTDNVKFSELKDAILQYKKDSKCIFLGEFLHQCSNIRKPNDKWYFWSKEMIEGIDKNEELMKRVLVAYGHSPIEALLENRCSEEWNNSIEEKIKGLIDGLKSIEEMVCGNGMSTVWGVLKNKGTTINRVKDAFRRGRRIRGIIDYVRYKHRKWDAHYKKVSEKIKRRFLYY